MKVLFLKVLCVLVVLHASLALAEELRVDHVYTDPGEVSVIVEPPQGLTPQAADFRLTAEGTPIATAQESRSFRDTGRGMALVLCIDVSGTMRGAPLEEVKQALLAFLARVRPEERIALVSFADEDTIESSFTDTPEHHADAVRNLQVRGDKTRLRQTVYKALEMVQHSSLPARRRVIVISDGKDEGSAEGIDSVVAKSKQNIQPIPIDTIGRGKIDQEYIETLRGLSTPTGGYFVRASPERLALTDALNRLYEDLLATRSLVVSFQYMADASQPMIEHATLHLQRVGQSPLQVQMPVKIPAPYPASSIMPWWGWVAATVVLLAIGLIVWNRRPAPGEEPLETPRWETREPPVPSAFPDGIETSPSHDVGHGSPPPRTRVGTPLFTPPGPGKPTAILRAVSGPTEGQLFPIEKDVFQIGAGPGNDLTLGNDDYLSGEHAYLMYDHGSLVIFDKGSRNGTLVNQQQVTNAGFRLSTGDQIQLGMSTFEVVQASP